jgi:predicted GNAT family acetyltransferase
MAANRTGHAGAMDIEIIDERHGQRGEYRLRVDGAEAGELSHRTDATVRTFTHTGVRPAFEGHGLAAQLVRRGLDDARAEGLTIVPQCPYVRGYIDKHPEYRDLVATER